MTTNAGEAKAALRARIRAARAGRSSAERDEAGHRIAATMLSLPEMQAASVVAAYLSSATEPSTSPLLEALSARQIRVLLPVQRQDGELDWAWYAGSDALARGPHGIDEPSGDRVGPDAIALAHVVVVPALAVDRRGQRLGQGGGGYDRALRRVRESAAGVLTVAVVYEDELLEAIPVEIHDMSVSAVATPSEVIRAPRA